MDNGQLPIEKELKNVSSEAKQAKIVSAYGANLRDDDLHLITTLPMGLEVALIGESRTDGTITRRKARVSGWIADNDGEDQILEEI